MHSQLGRAICNYSLIVVVTTLVNGNWSCGNEPAPANSRQTDTDLVSPRRIQRLVMDGNHNAFTALVTWQDEYWLAFRKATDHGSIDGTITVLRSHDAETWKKALRLDVLADDRDPQWLVTPSRLMLYSLNWTTNR